MKVLILFLLVSLSGCKFITQAASTTFAKEYCSCRWVEMQDDAYCKEVSWQVVRVKKYKVNEQKMTVKAKALGLWGSAYFVSSTRGCRVD